MYNKTTEVNDNAFTYINLDYMDMMSDGDDSMKKIMLEMLLEEIPQELEKMKTEVAASNWEGLSSVSHKMKSTLAFVGNDVMTEANKELELIGKNPENTGNAGEFIATLERTYTDVQVELKKALEAL